MKEAFLRVWRGEETLFITFWLWLVLGGLIVSLPQTMLMLTGYSFPADAYWQAYGFCVYRAAVLAFQFAVAVGLWRAASPQGVPWPDKAWRLGARVVALATAGGVVGAGAVQTAANIIGITLSLAG
ncbi:hypothetical protein Dde_4020 [Oleidesulfovibrio alaskensis G20]|jgi:hypothetical protein|uniref:Uncharacterized protein n=1 Tax=Oleidesulfovibrio alaskensis (strain ATCC BAA-1058 / DSM 17464 / G20) TaxID=207559 RepID=F9XXJ9_OLEA2|nr:hypothetical protein [Oleidesulfovibrio alaskensis]AEL79419.1 hypothetical protein Dde_4020 [Oleidesulfovibrio alaskensis G20]MBG0772902.1 hypothetical protein [Oleidesulfovibrio alaskensis]